MTTRLARWIDRGATAEIKRGLVKRQTVRQTPQIEMIALGAADEAAEHVTIQRCREAAAVAHGHWIMNGAWAAKLAAAVTDRLEVKQSQNLLH